MTFKEHGGDSEWKKKKKIVECPTRKEGKSNKLN